MRRLAAFVLLALAGDAGANRRDWTGSAACAACHAPEYKAWLASPHARSRPAGTLEPRCLACHGTGEVPAGPAVEGVVGCEACHGAGAAYAEDDLMRDLPLARALGLVEIQPKRRAQVCDACHTTALSLATGRPFDPTAKVH